MKSNYNYPYGVTDKIIDQHFGDEVYTEKRLRKPPKEIIEILKKKNKANRNLK